MEFYASCPEGFEIALADELRALGLQSIRRLKGRVAFAGAPADAQRACLWSRLASRVFCVVARIGCLDADDLYENAAALAWEDILRPEATIAVSAHGTNAELRNTHFAALRVKDAICDRLARTRGSRPNVDTERPDARISLTIRNDRASLQLDLSGEALFKRLPAEATREKAAHVLRPDYAALALAQAGWQTICERTGNAPEEGSSGMSVPTNTSKEPNAASGAASRTEDSNPSATPAEASNVDTDAADGLTASDTHAAAAAGDTPTADNAPRATAVPVLIDACCAGGGIALEAAQILAQRAPGLDRERWGFLGWASFDEPAWQDQLTQARARAERASACAGRIIATDVSGDAVACACRVIRAAGLTNRVIFVQPSAEAIARKLPRPSSHAHIVGACTIDTTEVALARLPRVLGLVADLRRTDTELDGTDGAAASMPLVALTRDSIIERTFAPAANLLAIKPNNEDAQLISFPAPNDPACQAPEATADTSAHAPRTRTGARVTTRTGENAPAPAQAGMANATVAPPTGAASAAQTATTHPAAARVEAPRAGTPRNETQSTLANAGQRADHAGAAAPANPAASQRGRRGTGPAHPHAAPPTFLNMGNGDPLPLLVPESEQFANRLRKVAKQRRKWAARTGVTCYRVYDADLPDYSAAIDLYEGSASTLGRWLVIAEYAAPASVDAGLAQARFLDILAIAPRILQVDPEHVYAKARMRSRGGSQYAQRAGRVGKGTQAVSTGGTRPGNAGGAPGSRPSRPGNQRGPARANGTGAHGPSAPERMLPLIEEGGLTFAVNFDDYLDTGIFLDHRLTRDLVREHARSRRYFLNLFAYTGTATCYAADAGVEETVTVDLSNTYLDWAERNMRQNGFTGREHHYVRADVMSWISEMRQTRNRWDLIFCDPPTFSNSSKMGRRTWDVQRDHVELLIGLSRLLTRDGEAIFSCNLRTFRPDVEALARAGVVMEDISAQTIPEDFARNPRIHRCYLVCRRTPEEAMRLIGKSEAEIRERSRELRESARRGRR